MKKYQVVVIVGFIILIKLLILPVTSFPFDFASYIYQVRQFFDFGLHPLFYWNKGLFLQFMFFGQHSLYDFIRYIFSFSENINLLHFLFKIPLLLFDLLCATYLGKIIYTLTEKRKLQIIIIFLWLLNPMIFWTAEVQGKYAIVASFFVILSFYLYISGRKKWSLVPLAIATSIYYYPLVIFPIFLFFYLQEKNKSLFSIDSLKYGVIFGLTLIILFSSFLTSSQYLEGLTSSLLHHAQPDSPIDTEEIKISHYSLFKMPYYVLTNIFPSNIVSPNYFNLVSKVTLVGLIFVAIYQLFLYFKIKKKDIIYSPHIFLQYILGMLLLFIIFVGKFQAHYLIWIFPFLLLYSIYKINNRFLFLYCALSILPIIITLGYLNLGIFFLDSVQWGNINLWLNLSELLTTTLGSIVMILLICTLIILFSIKNEVKTKENNEQAFIRKSYIVIMFFSVLFLCALYPIGQSYVYILQYGSSKQLAAENSVLRFAMSMQKIDSQFKIDSELFFKDSFEDVSSEILSKTAPIPDNTNQGFWHFYLLSQNNSVAVQSSREAHSGKQSMMFDIKKNDAKSQINMGSNNSQNLIPVVYNKKYNVKLFIKSSYQISDIVNVSVRFADENRKIIPGSDVLFNTDTILDDWILINKTFRPLKPTYKYVEIVISEDVSKVDNIMLPIQIYIDDVSIEMEEIPNLYQYILIGKSNLNLIQNNIIAKTDTQDKFEIKVILKNVYNYDRVDQIQLNKCFSVKNKHDIDKIEYSFPASCIQYNQNNILEIKYSDVPINSQVQTFLIHKNSDRVNQFETKYFIISIFLLLFALFSNLLLTLILYKEIKKYFCKDR